MSAPQVVGYGLRCEGCGYSWIPRVTEPRECPNCKRRLKIDVSKPVVIPENQVNQL